MWGIGLKNAIKNLDTTTIDALGLHALYQSGLKFTKHNYNVNSFIVDTVNSTLTI